MAKTTEPTTEPTYDVILRLNQYPEPDFVKTGRRTVTITSTILENGAFFAGDQIAYGAMGENGFALVKPLYDKLAAKCLKAGASREKDNRDDFTLTGAKYSKVVDLEQFWAEFHADLAALGKIKLAQDAAAAAEAEKPGRRRRRRR